MPVKEINPKELGNEEEAPVDMLQYFFFLSFFKNSSPCYAVRGLFPGRRVVAGGDRIRFEVARHTEVCLGGSTPQ